MAQPVAVPSDQPGSSARHVVTHAVRLPTAHRFRLAWRLAWSLKVPMRARLPLVALLVYLALPLDILPDFIPVLGQLDDLLIAGIAVWWFLRVCPPAVAMAEIEQLEQLPLGPVARRLPWLLGVLSGVLILLAAVWLVGGDLQSRVVSPDMVPGVRRWLFLLVGGWLAATVSGAVGFGGALLLLPVLTLTVGAKAAVPILTLAQLLSNGSRAGFGFRDIRWRPALLFSAGAVPAAIIGARLFVALPAGWLLPAIGVFLLLVVAVRHTRLRRHAFPTPALIPAGAVVGFLSAVVGSAGPLGAAVFLSLHLPRLAYVATEAVTAVVMHVTKTAVYGRYALLSPGDVLGGLALGGAMVLGSWTGRKLIERLSERWFGRLVEVLLVLTALALIAGVR